MTGSKCSDDVIGNLSSLLYYHFFGLDFSRYFDLAARTTGSSRVTWSLLLKVQEREKHFFPRCVCSVSRRDCYWVHTECRVPSLPELAYVPTEAVRDWQPSWSRVKWASGCFLKERWLWVGCCWVTELCLTLQPTGPQRARLPWPSLSLGVCSNSCPLTWWCYLGRYTT